MKLIKFIWNILCKFIVRVACYSFIKELKITGNQMHLVFNHCWPKKIFIIFLFFFSVL